MKKTQAGLVVLAVVVLLGVGYGIHRASSGAAPEPQAAPVKTQSPETAPPIPAPQEAARPPSPRVLYVASPWARLYSEPRPDSYKWADQTRLGTRVQVDAAKSQNGFIFVSSSNSDSTVQQMDGYLRESDLRAEPFTFDEAWNEALNALGTLKVESASRYLELASRLDPSRIEPLEIQAVIRRERLHSAIDLETMAEKLAPGQGPKNADELTVGDIWYLYPEYISDGVIDGLRETPDPKAPSGPPLEKGEPLRILELGQDWLRVARVDDGNLRELGTSSPGAPDDAGVSTDSSGQEPPPEPTLADLGKPRVLTGYLRSGMLKPWPEERERLERHLKLHMQAEDSRQAVRLMMGVAQAEPERSLERARAEEALLAFALKAQQYKVAAHAAMRLRRLDDMAVELTYLFGCRGDRTQAEMLKVSEIDQAKPKQGPQNACLIYDRTPEDCAFCAGAEDYEGETPDFRAERASEAKRRRQEERLWERLSEAFPDGPYLRVRYAATPASARNGLPLYILSQSYHMKWVCQDGRYWASGVSSDKREAVQLEWPRSGEALSWLKPLHEGDALMTVRFLEDSEGDKNYPLPFVRESEMDVLSKVYSNDHQEVSKEIETRYGMMPYTFAPNLDGCPDEPDLHSATE
ncbi:hypothetical protein [Archangium lansingense]|uniref:SH3 domain-containing protein n=1 Tax=Archangium lansingense TaxID=2995310 RepID=A0ABT4AKU5_9BACT|nr:hypothetical protein [Archangium lansinium]MCY1082319.1 hypothetical protein [Archangium lansinium]